MAGTFIQPWWKIGLAIEASKGTAEPDGDCSIVRAAEVRLPKVISEALESEGDPASTLAVQEILEGRRYGEVGLKVPLKGADADVTAPRLGPLLSAAGLGGAAYGQGAPSGYKYTWADTSLAACTLKNLAMLGEYRLDLYHCAARRAQIIAPTGGLCFLDVDLVGRFEAETLSGSDISYTEEDSSQLVFKNATLTQAVGEKWRNFELTIENTVAEIPDPTDEHAVGGFEVTHPRRITGSYDPMIEAATKLYAGATLDFELKVGSGSNILIIDADNVQLVDRSLLNRDNQLAFQIAFQCLYDSVGETLSLSFQYDAT
jgi:hypothetical protein